jgi:exosome complex exonuclease DIS3/RRP44
MNVNYIFRKIKKGNIAKVVRTKALRDDIPCGALECKACQNNQSSSYLTIQRMIILLDSNLIMEQIDAFENFDILNNCIIPQSEYIYINEKNLNIFNRLNNIIDNRNIYLFPNEFHRETSIVNEISIKKKALRELKFIRTIEYFDSHFSEIQDDIILYVLTNADKKQNYQSAISGNNIKILTLNEFAQMEMKESPDLYNYIAQHDEAIEYHVNDDVDMKLSLFPPHLSESEMKINIKQGNLFQGKIVFQPAILNSAIVRAYIFDKEILINSTENLNRALHGDIVCIEILEESRWLSKEQNTILSEDKILEEEIDLDTERPIVVEPENEKQRNIKEKIEKTNKQVLGRVVGILRRNRTQFCGTIYNKMAPNLNAVGPSLEKIQNFQIFIPVDSKYPNFLIKLFQPELYYSKRILVKLDSWSEINPLPMGHFLKNFGNVSDVKVENEVILYEHGVDTNPFSQKIINSMPREDTELVVSDEEASKRLDLRGICVCSIDPPGCKDIDDALHCRVLQNGNYEVGVHIADVTHYVKAGTEVDRIAARNSNTVYLVHKRTDMLPKVLTENLCSLVGGRERLAFSCIWEIHSDTLEVINVRYSKTVIKSRAALTYQKANEIMNDVNDNSEIAVGIRNLNKIAKHFRKKRMDAGALILASNEMKFNVNFETNSINDITMYPTYETNQLVEEYMLLANVYVAEKIYNTYPSCAVIRRHPPPKEKETLQLKNLLRQYGYDIDLTDSKKLGESLDKLRREGDPFFNKLVRIMLTRTMNQAKYIGSSDFGYEDFYHYGLAMPIYTHFTSPIRRYADVLVHRLLAAALDVDHLPQDMTNKIKILKQSEQMNKQNRVAFFCSRESNDLSTYLFFQDKPEQMEVVLFGMDKNFVKGISTKYGIEADIQFINHKIKEVDTDKKVILLENGETLKVFDHVLVEIKAKFFNYRREIKYVYLQKN